MGQTTRKLVHSFPLQLVSILKVLWCHIHIVLPYHLHVSAGLCGATSAVACSAFLDEFHSHRAGVFDPCDALLHTLSLARAHIVSTSENGASGTNLLLYSLVSYAGSLERLPNATPPPF